MEYLTRGVHAVSDGSGKIFVSWRLLGTEDTTMAFNLYRTTGKKTLQLNKSLILAATCATGVTPQTGHRRIFRSRLVFQRPARPT